MTAQFSSLQVSGSAQVRHADNLVVGQEALRCGKVRNIASQLCRPSSAALHIANRPPEVSREKFSRALRPRLHRRKGFRVKHPLRRRGCRHVNGNIISLSQAKSSRSWLPLSANLVRCHAAVNRQIRVKAHNVHAQVMRRVGNPNADSAQADHAQGLPRNLRTHESWTCPSQPEYRPWHRPGQSMVLPSSIPCTTFLEESRSAADNQLLNRVGVCARSVEHNNTLLAAHLSMGMLLTPAPALCHSPQGSPAAPCRAHLKLLKIMPSGFAQSRRHNVIVLAQNAPSPFWKSCSVF